MCDYSLHHVKTRPAKVSDNFERAILTERVRTGSTWWRRGRSIAWDGR